MNVTAWLNGDFYNYYRTYAKCFKKARHSRDYMFFNIFCIKPKVDYEPIVKFMTLNFIQKLYGRLWMGKFKYFIFKFKHSIPFLLE